MGALRRLRFLLGAAGVLIVIATVPVAAEVVQEGGGPIRFHGSLRPTTLPRDRPAPVELSVGFRRPDPGAATAVDVSEIALALDRRVSIDFDGLPRCPLRMVLYEALEQSEPPEFCERAKVGWGRTTHKVAFPGQGGFRLGALLTAYNGRVRGLPAILVREDFISGGGRTRASVFVFEARPTGRRAGGTTLVAEAPEAAENNTLLAFDLTLRRNYMFDGKRRGYVSVICPVPRGASLVAFPLFRLDYRTDDGGEQFGIVNKQCKARALRP